MVRASILVICRAGFYFDFRASMHAKPLGGRFLIQRKLDVSGSAFDGKNLSVLGFGIIRQDTPHFHSGDPNQKRTIKIPPHNVCDDVAELVDAQDCRSEAVWS